MGSRASRPEESVKANIVVMMELSLEKTQTMTLKASGIVNQN